MSILEEQDLLGTEERMQEFVSILADDLQQEVKEVIRKETTTVRRWNAFVEHSKDQISSVKILHFLKLHIFEMNKRKFKLIILNSGSFFRVIQSGDGKDTWFTN